MTNGYLFIDAREGICRAGKLRRGKAGWAVRGGWWVVGGGWWVVFCYLFDSCWRFIRKR